MVASLLSAFGTGGGSIAAPSSAAGRADAKSGSSGSIAGVNFGSPFNVGTGSDSMNNLVLIGGLVIGGVLLARTGVFGGKSRKRKS